MFFKKGKKKELAAYDKTGKIPVIRASICTGEKVAGFRDETTGKFEELMLIRDDGDLRKFMLQYQIGERTEKKNLLDLPQAKAHSDTSNMDGCAVPSSSKTHSL